MMGEVVLLRWWGWELPLACHGCDCFGCLLLVWFFVALVPVLLVAVLLNNGR